MASYRESTERARTIIDTLKSETAYFDGSLSYQELYIMFREQFRFGYAETNVILSALVLAGAKFAQD